MKTLEEFKKEILGVGESRKHKVSNSVGVYDAYKYIRKNKWKDIGRPLTEHEFYSIIRRMGDYFAEALCQGYEIIFPARMGRLELRKNAPFIGYKDGKLQAHLTVDWDATLKLWYEDEEAYKNKQLVKSNVPAIFKVLYNRDIANYNNQAFYEFQVNRRIKRTLTKRIRAGRIDAYER